MASTCFTLNLILIIFLLSCHHNLISVVHGMLPTYGESCEDGRACLGRHVMCLASGNCGCSSQDSMTYDERSQSCLINLRKSCGGDRQCLEGAVCDRDQGICRCEIGFYATSNGNCLPKKSFKEPCITDLECGVSRNNLIESHHKRPLACIQGICQCDRKSDVYSEERGTCVGLVDSECHISDDSDIQCTSNAECRHSSLSKDKVFSGSSTTCQCRSGFAKTSQGKCAFGFGNSCGTNGIVSRSNHLIDGNNNKCADVHFICIDGKCTCKFPMHQLYDERAKECLSLVSGPCTFPKNSQMNLMGPHDFPKCVKNAHCVDRGFYSECSCRPGFVATRSGTCAPGYAQPCDAGDCDPDSESQLFCRNGVCECLDLLQVYDSTLKKCRGLVGSRCATTSDNKPLCVEFASCVVPEPRLPGKCLCDKYSQEQTNRTCAVGGQISKSLF